MGNANKCPNCNAFILGTFCFNCKMDISEMEEENPFFKMFNDIMSKKGEKE